jgi:SHS2 domain-containing protein
MGFEEIPHTADWAVRVWSADMPGLLAESARAMRSLAGVVMADAPRMERALTLEAPDRESMLVAFLSELLFFEEHEHLAFDRFEFNLGPQRASIEMQGAPVIRFDKAIKAVTWHDLKIEEMSEGLEVRIVFDV